MSAGNVAVPNTDDNTLNNDTPIKSKDSRLIITDIPFAHIRQCNDNCFLADGQLLDMQFNRIGEGLPLSVSDYRCTPYMDTFLTIVYIYDNKLNVRLYQKGLDGACTHMEYSISLPDKKHININRILIVHEDKICILMDNNRHNAGKDKYGLVFSEFNKFGQITLLKGDESHYVDIQLISDQPIFIIYGNEPNPNGIGINSSSLHRVAYIYDYTFQLIRTVAAERYNYIKLPDRLLIPSIPDGNVAKYYEISYKPINYEKLCIKCSKPKTKDAILSCGHRNYCASCIENIKQCTICGKEVNVIHIK